jgi:hypothetical protein
LLKIATSQNRCKESMSPHFLLLFFKSPIGPQEGHTLQNLFSRIKRDSCGGFLLGSVWACLGSISFVGLSLSIDPYLFVRILISLHISLFYWLINSWFHLRLQVVISFGLYISIDTYIFLTMKIFVIESCVAANKLITKNLRLAHKD